jgi:RNA polymerase sigma factor (TIGR02999 family)
MSEVTRILSAMEEGDARAGAQLLPLVYDELRKLAAHRLAQEKPGQTLDATALVHEAYLRLVETERGDSQPPWCGRGHFFAAAAEAMRRILIEKARHKKRLKSAGHLHRVQESAGDPAVVLKQDDILAIDEALTKLAAEDPSAAELVKLRFYAGLSMEEIANALDISRATAYRHWTYARAWLRCELGSE